MNDSIHKIEIASEATAPVEPQKEKESQAKPSVHEMSSAMRWLILHLQILRKILPIFPKEMNEDALILMKKKLKKFLQSLQELSEKDVSHDTAFLLQLSHRWSQFLQYFSPLTIAQNEEKKYITEFLLSLHDTPRGERYSLGYYLSEAAGETWVPVPFMNLLHNLFAEYQKEKEASTLFRWIDLLEKYLEAK